MRQFSDAELEKKILELQLAIKEWAERKELWFDASFKPFLKHVDAEPSREYPVVTVLCAESPLSQLIGGSDYDEWQMEFYDYVESLGYELSDINGVNFYFYPTDPDLISAFGEYFHWQWVCSLIQPEFGDVYEELYDYFSKNPDRLYSLKWREYEMLLSRIFQQQGFHAELGPGSGDGGVDIRLLQRDPLGDILTLVQVKKYNPKNKIQLEAVAALHGVAEVERADRSLFITTSEYAPVAKNFAARTSGRLQLKTSDDVSIWCREAADGIITDKSSLVSKDSISKIIQHIGGKRDARIVHATSGWNMTHNHFALVLKETKHAALLMSLPNHKFTDRYGQTGTEIPILGAAALEMHKPEHVRRAKRQVRDYEVTYWDGSKLYSSWDGGPMRFNYMD